MRSTAPLFLLLLASALPAEAACPDKTRTDCPDASAFGGKNLALGFGVGSVAGAVMTQPVDDAKTAGKALGLGAVGLTDGVEGAGYDPNLVPNALNKAKAAEMAQRAKLAEGVNGRPLRLTPGKSAEGAEQAASPVDFVAMAESAATPQIAAVWRHVGSLSDGGDKASALAAAQRALAENPQDRQLLEFVKMNTPRTQERVTQKTVSDRAKELLATLRGDAGDAPAPGKAAAASPSLASAAAFPAFTASGGPRTLSPAALSALANKDSGLKLADPLVRSAVSKFMVRDLPAAEALLDRRLEQNPSDEPALRFRALTRRQLGRYEPSAHDAKAALGLAPWDVRAHRVLIDDEIDLGHSEQALEEANRAMLETPNSAELLVARSDAYASLGNREAQLADLKQAAMLDAQFDQLYQQALAGPALAHVSKRPHSTAVWLGAIGTALLFFSFAAFRKRGESSVRMAMREEDHALLSRGARPDAAPAGFKIIKTLGQGGMGVVYEAVDLGLQRTVALKKLRAEIADSPRERARFLKEARTVAGLKHPNIVEIHAIHEDAEGLFLVFEKVSGETLHERLGRGAMPAAEAVAVLRQVAKALDCAHSAGVVHQDLKPANIMVAGDVAKVMDFGIARRVQETMSTLSRIEVAGTPAYMAPEQERGGGVGPAADIFALGACAYELLTGRTPFPNGGMMMKAEKMYRPASEVNPGLSAAADNAISRALEPEPAGRWPSASSFVDALARSLAVTA